MPDFIAAWENEGHQTMAPGVVAIIMVVPTYGLYIPIFTSSLCALFTMNVTPNRRTLVWISIVQFILITLHLLFYILDGCFWLSLYYGARPSSFDDPLLQPSPTSLRPLETFSWFVLVPYFFASALADAVFTYRLFHVWGQNWFAVIVPILCMLASAATALVTESGGPNGLWWLSQLITTLLLNVYITSLISYKVWQNDKAMGFLDQPRMNHVILVLLESAGLYTVFLSFALFCYLFPFHVTASAVAQVTLAPIIGITYSLMIILVANGRSRDIKYPTTSALVFRQSRSTGINTSNEGPDVYV